MSLQLSGSGVVTGLDSLASSDLGAQLGSKLPYAYGTATPSTTVDGFLWYDENDTPPTPKYWNGSAFAALASAPSMQLVASETLSGSAVNINGCFTSTYRNYFLTVQCNHSTDTNLVARLRASGSDASGTNYNYYQFRGSGATSLSANNTSQTVWQFDPVSGVGQKGAHVWIYGPNLAAATGYLSTCYNVSTAGIGLLGGNHDVTSAYDGISLISLAGTFTSGAVRIYGLKD